MPVARCIKLQKYARNVSVDTLVFGSKIYKSKSEKYILFIDVNMKSGKNV